MGVGAPRIGLTPGPGRVPGEAFTGPIEIRYIQYPSEIIFSGRGLYMDWENRYITYPATSVNPGSDLYIRSVGGGSSRSAVFTLKGNSTFRLPSSRKLIRTVTQTGAGKHLLSGVVSGPSFANLTYESVRVQLGSARVRTSLASNRVRANLARFRERREIL